MELPIRPDEAGFFDLHGRVTLTGEPSIFAIEMAIQNLTGFVNQKKREAIIRQTPPSGPPEDFSVGEGLAEDA